MAVPFFSILLPTKNRAGLLPYAMRCLRDQTFADFEVILADNDDSGATAEMVAALAPGLDGRIQYLRTGGLWMAQNWEAALRRSCGAYVYVLEDKAVLHPRALEMLAQALEFSNARCVVFNQLSHPAPAMATPAEAPAIVMPALAPLPDGRLPLRQVTVSRILDGFLEEGWRWLHDEGPRSINSVSERELIEQVRDGGGGGCFFLPVAPDVTSNLLQLDLLESVTRLDLDLVSFAAHAHLSHGWQLRMSLAGGAQVLAAAGPDNTGHFARMPLGALPLLHNLLYADFLRVRDGAQGRLLGKTLSSERYFAGAEEDLRVLETFGEVVGPVREAVRAAQARHGNARI